MRNFLTHFLEQFDYPAESKPVIMDCFDKLSADSEAMAVIEKHLSSYAESGTEQYVACHGEIVTIAARLGTPWQTARLILDIFLHYILSTL